MDLAERLRFPVKILLLQNRRWPSHTGRLLRWGWRRNGLLPRRCPGRGRRIWSSLRDGPSSRDDCRLRDSHNRDANGSSPTTACKSKMRRRSCHCFKDWDASCRPSTALPDTLAASCPALSATTATGLEIDQFFQTRKVTMQAPVIAMTAPKNPRNRRRTEAMTAPTTPPPTDRLCGRNSVPSGMTNKWTNPRRRT